MLKGKERIFGARSGSGHEKAGKQDGGPGGKATNENLYNKINVNFLDVGTNVGTYARGNTLTPIAKTVFFAWTKLGSFRLRQHHAGALDAVSANRCLVVISS
jgi:hypothetical protein